MARAPAAAVVVGVTLIVGILARWWKTIRHLGSRQIPPASISFCFCTAAVVLIWAEFSRAQEDDTITVTTTAEDDDNTGVDEKEEASSPAVSDNARMARDAESWFLISLGGFLVLVLLGCCLLNIYRESLKRQKRRLGKNLPGLRLDEETKNWSRTLEARKQQFSTILANEASSDGVQRQQRGKYFAEAFDYPRIMTGMHLSSDSDDLSIVERSLSLTSVTSQGGSAYGFGSNSSRSNNYSKKTNTMRSQSGGAFNYPRITTGVHLSSGISDLSIVERSLSMTSVASRGGSTFGLGSNSSSSNNNKRKNTITLGADLSDTIIFEGDELQGKKAPGEKGTGRHVEAYDRGSMAKEDIKIILGV